MGSRTILLSGFLLAFVLLISSGVAVRDLVETSTLNKNDEVTGKKDALTDYPPAYPTAPTIYGGPPSPGGLIPYGPGGSGGSCPKGCCGGGYEGKGCICC